MNSAEAAFQGNIPAYILAGGMSTRFGGDKALAEVDGRTLIEHVAGQLRPHVGSITVVAERPGKYQHLGLATIADGIPGHGPIGGLLRALEHCEGPGWMLLAACDAVILDATSLEQLWSARNNVAGVIAWKGDEWEPLPGLYHTRILPEVRGQIARGEMALWRLIERVAHKALNFPADRPVLAQINTPEDLRKYRQSLKQ